MDAPPDTPPADKAAKPGQAAEEGLKEAIDNLGGADIATEIDTYVEGLLADDGEPDGMICPVCGNEDDQFSSQELEEAVSRLRRGELREAIIWLSRSHADLADLHHLYERAHP